MTSKARRITAKLKTPNPLFEMWLTEWKEQAVTNDSKMQYTFNNALQSLRKYPLPFDSGKDCIILKGFGNKLCDMLDKKLRDYRNNGGEIPFQLINQNSPRNTPNKNIKRKANETETKSPKKSRSTRPYQPSKGTGGYGILIALLKRSQDPYYTGSLNKDEIIEVAQHFSDKSFVKPDPGSFYTAWSSMSTLITKGLVTKIGSPPKFSLTDEGEILAVTLFESHNDSVETEKNARARNINSIVEVFSKENNHKSTQNSSEYKINNDYDTLLSEHVEYFNYDENRGKNLATESCIINISPSTSSEITEIFKNDVGSNNFLPSNSKTLPETKLNKEHCTEDEYSSQASCNFEIIIFAPDTFDIILLVDTQETAGSKNKIHDETLLELNKFKINFEVRHLKVGDFTWVCRERSTKQELVLPYIVERKRMDDLGHSIKDGRFHEQKFRLKQCGIENIIYIVEKYGNNTQTVLPLTTLLQAATNTTVQDQFQVKFTDNHRGSMEYLSSFTSMLQHIYGQKTVMSSAKENLGKLNISDDLIPLLYFDDFNKGASKAKKYTVKEMFIRQLLAIKGVSVDKAQAIAEEYPCPKLLKLKYDQLSNIQGEKLLANITFGLLKKSVGPVISKILYQLYTTYELV